MNEDIVFDLDDIQETPVESGQEPIVENQDDDIIIDDSQDEPADNTQEPNNQEIDESLQFLYEEYKSKGLIMETEDDKFDNTPEWLDKQLSELPNTIKRNIIESVPKEAQDFVDLLLTKDNLTKEDFTKFFNDFLSDEQPKVDTLDDAREVLEKHLKAQGLRQSAIKAQLDDLEDEDLLIEEAQKLVSQTKSKTKQNLEQVSQEQKQYQEQQQVFIQKIEQEIQSLPEARRKVVAQTATKVNDIISEISSDEKKYVAFLDVLSYYKNGTFDLSAFEKQVKTASNQTLRDKLSQKSIGLTTKQSDKQIKEKDYELVV